MRRAARRLGRPALGRRSPTTATFAAGGGSTQATAEATAAAHRPDLRRARRRLGRCAVDHDRRRRARGTLHRRDHPDRRLPPGRPRGGANRRARRPRRRRPTSSPSSCARLQPQGQRHDQAHRPDGDPGADRSNRGRVLRLSHRPASSRSSVEVRRAGDVDASFITFVDRLATGTDARPASTDRMQVGVAVARRRRTHAAPPTASTEVERRGPRLGAPRRSTCSSRSARHRSPSASGPELVEGLSPVACRWRHPRRSSASGAPANVDLLALPYVDVDPSAAATSGLQDQFTAQLTER